MSNEPTFRRCSVDGCERKHRANGYCETHNFRFKKYGDAGSAAIELRDPTRCCAVDDCSSRARAGGYCEKHYQRFRATGSATTPLPERGPRWTGDRATYNAVHLRIRKMNGPARLQTCFRCGDAADHWAYDHADPNARVDGKHRLPYSLDPDHYIALCKTCHRRMDAEITRTDVCSVPGCGGPHKARGMCNRHYRRALQEERRGEAGSPRP